MRPMQISSKINGWDISSIQSIWISRVQFDSMRLRVLSETVEWSIFRRFCGYFQILVFEDHFSKGDRFIRARIEKGLPIWFSLHCETKWVRFVAKGSALSSPNRRRLLICYDTRGGYGDDKWVQGGSNPEAYDIWHWHGVKSGMKGGVLAINCLKQKSLLWSMLSVWLSLLSLWALMAGWYVVLLILR